VNPTTSDLNGLVYCHKFSISNSLYTHQYKLWGAINMSNLIKNNPKERDSQIELLRIISMFLIVMNHYSVNDPTIAAREALPFCVNKVILQAITFMGG